RSFSQTRTAADSAGSEVLPATASEASRLRAQSLVSWESIIALPCHCAATLNIEAWKNATPFSAPRTGAAVKVRQPLCFRGGVKRSAGGKEWRDHPAGTSEELMAKKSQKSKRRCDELPILHPDAAGIDVGASELFVAVSADRDPKPVRSFPTFTRDLNALADWLQRCGIR